MYVFLKEYAIRVILIETRRKWYLECAVLKLYTNVTRVLIDDIFPDKNWNLPIIHHRKITHMLKY